MSILYCFWDIQRCIMACPHPANLYTICKSLKAAAAYSTSLLHCFLHSKPRTCATSCQSSTVTICLFFIVSEIQRFFWLESHFSSFTLHPVSFAAIKRDVPLLPVVLKLIWKNGSLWATRWRKPMTLRASVFTWYRLVAYGLRTDRQTDGAAYT